MKFGFIGTHNSGKSTVVWHVATELKKRGFNRFNVIPENARFCPYPLDGSFQSQLWMLTEQIRMEIHGEQYHHILLCDRSVYDMVAYASAHNNSTRQMKILASIADVWGKLLPYEALFLFEPLTLEDDGVRSMDTEFQQKVYEKLQQVLIELAPSCTPIIRIRGKKERRCDQVFQQIRSWLPNE